MNNVNLSRDVKENRFLSMRWERKVSTNEIIAFDGTTRHHYSFTSRKKLNQDWQTLLVLKRKSNPDNVQSYGLGDKVVWHGRKCIVTNAFVCGGKKITISPVGNGESPAKYYDVFKDEVNPDNVQNEKHGLT